MSILYNFSFQDYQEQEYEYGAHDRTITSKAQTSKKKSKKKAEEDIGKYIGYLFNLFDVAIWCHQI